MKYCPVVLQGNQEGWSGDSFKKHACFAVYVLSQANSFMQKATTGNRNMFYIGSFKSFFTNRRVTNI